MDPHSRTEGDFRVDRYRPGIEGGFARSERWTNIGTQDETGGYAVPSAELVPSTHPPERADAFSTRLGLEVCTRCRCERLVLLHAVDLNGDPLLPAGTWLPVRSWYLAQVAGNRLAPAHLLHPGRVAHAEGASRPHQRRARQARRQVRVQQGHARHHVRGPQGRAGRRAAGIGAAELLWELSACGGTMKPSRANLIFYKGGFMEISAADCQWLAKVLNGTRHPKVPG